jgi:hypothetical protein
MLASHPVPHGNRPIIASGIVVAAALPIFLIAGWPIAGWALAAVLWVVAQLIGRVIRRMPLGVDNVPTSGVAAMGRMVRTITVGVVLVAVTVSDQSVGLSAALVYAAAFSVEFGMSLASYFGSEAGRT